MFTPFVRLFILLFLGIAAVVMANRGEYSMLLLASGISLFLLWDYTYRGSIPLALGRFYKNDLVGVEKYLAYTARPHVLNKQSQAKFHFLKGMIAHDKDEFKSANENLELALAIPIKDKTLKVMSLLTLTDIHIMLKKPRLARDYFEQLNGMSIPKSLIPTVTKLEAFLDNNNPMK